MEAVAVKEGRKSEDRGRKNGKEGVDGERGLAISG